MSETTKALFKDALYQVLDNKVFRLLVVLVGVLVLPTFLIAAEPEQLRVLFGWKTYQYSDVLAWFEMAPPADPAESHATLIQGAQRLLVDNLAGTFGLIFAVAATAFFVPRMVEKGAADTVFSKPVSRGALLLSRYVAGLLFVGILAIVLVGGMHVGLLLNSGYSDPGFLWSIPVIVYKYGILHAFSLLVAVLTRSSVAAILTTLMFFALNACVHVGWSFKESAQERARIELGAGEEPEGEDDPEELVHAFLFALDTLHYVLPKITDAAVISQSLRDALAERRMAYRDAESGLMIAKAPARMEPVELGPADRPLVARWVDPRDPGASVSLRRWPLSERKRTTALRELEQQLETQGIEKVDKEKEHLPGGLRADARSWTEPRGELQVEREALLFLGKGYLFQLDAELPAGWSDRDEENRWWEWRFRRGIELEGHGRDEHELFETRAAWSGELKYNLWFSIASTLAFVLLTLALAWWRLSRIDF